MYEKQLTRLLVRPSLLSGAVVSIAAALLLLGSVWPTVTESSLFRQVTLNSHAVTDAVQLSPELGDFVDTFSASPLTYNVIIVGVGLLVAVLTYVMLQLVSKTIVGTYDTIEALQHTGRIQGSAHDTRMRAVVRSLSAVGLLVFAAFFAVIVLPYSLFIVRVGASDALGSGALQLIYAYLLLAVSLHMFVVFTRLILLRPRVFGGQLAISAALFEADAKHRN